MLAVSCPLVNGTLLVPRVLSNAADAPYLGEAGILYNLTRVPAAGVQLSSGGRLPGFVIIVLGIQIATGLALAWIAWRSVRQFRSEMGAVVFPAKRLQASIWLVIISVGLLCFCLDNVIAGAIAIIFMQVLPRGSRNDRGAGVGG